VGTADGELLQIEGGQRESGVVPTADGGRLRVLPWPGEDDAPRPLVRADGLVAERPDGVGYDPPFFQDYFWVAVLDPVELADGLDPGTGARGPGTAVASVTEVEHAGRPAWEAVLRPTPAYRPRCACCALLWSRESDLIEHGPEGLRDDYPEAYRVRLDVGTGVCVLTEELGAADGGSGHVLRIEAVDEPMPEALFRAGVRGSFTRPARPR
jgi:hypothetical protein